MIYEFKGNNYEVNEVLDRHTHKVAIKIEQEKLKENLQIKDGGLTVIKPSSKVELSKGCQACKTGTWWCLFVGYTCNMRCKFCPQPKTQEYMESYNHPRSVAPYWIDDVKTYVDIYGKTNKVTGISYSGGEPFLYIDKVTEIAEYVSNNSDWYQWIYTNGTVVTDNKMKQLAKVGIKEIRFDLAATNFDSRILKIVEKASNYFERVTIEIPSIPEVEKKLIDENYLKTLENIGVTQLNLAELQLEEPINFETYAVNNTIYIYDDILGVSPTLYASRFITYRVIEKAIKDKIDILINDCSMDAKHLQRLKRADNLPIVLR